VYTIVLHIKIHDMFSADYHNDSCCLNTWDKYLMLGLSLRYIVFKETYIVWTLYAAVYIKEIVPITATYLFPKDW